MTHLYQPTEGPDDRPPIPMRAEMEWRLRAKVITCRSQQRTIRQQEQQIQQLLRRLSGVKQERVDPDQLLLFSAEELDALTRELREQPPHSRG